MLFCCQVFLKDKKNKKKEGHFKYWRMTYENGQTCASQVPPCMPDTSNANTPVSRNFVYKARRTWLKERGPQCDWFFPHALLFSRVIPQGHVNSAHGAITSYFQDLSISARAVILPGALPPPTCVLWSCPGLFGLATKPKSSGVVWRWEATCPWSHFGFAITP